MTKLLASFAIFAFLWLPLVVVGLPATFLLLLAKWNGTTTWFGNYLYGRQGNSHVPPDPSLFEQWLFLAIRNPVSNFGKFTLSRGPDSGAWLIDKTWWRLGILYGWKHADTRLPGSRRPFVFRPYFSRPRVRAQ